MRHSMKRTALQSYLILLFFGVCLFFSTSVFAVSFRPALESSEWYVRSSIYECRMSQIIPNFGEAVITHQAGLSVSFQLFSDLPKMKAGKAAVRAISPFWKPGGEVTPLGFVDVSEGKTTLDLNAQLTNRVIEALYQGQQIEVIRRSRFDPETSVVVSVSNVNFRGAYDKYLECLATLLPVNFDQVERVSISFASGKNTLDAESLEKIRRVLSFVNAKTGVQSIYIDGHTDSFGTRAENLEISKRRAEIVKNSLVKGGVDDSKIWVRWHGERYPVASNRTPSGRAENRRVTIRLSKNPLPEIAFDEINKSNMIDDQEEKIMMKEDDKMMMEDKDKDEQMMEEKKPLK